VEGGPAAGAQGRGGLLVALVGRGKCPLDGHDQERHRHECLGEHDAGGGERQRDADRGQGRAEDAAPAEGEQQPDATDHRGQDQRQGHQGAQEPPAGEAQAGEHPRQRHPEQQRQPGRRGRGQGQDEEQHADQGRQRQQQRHPARPPGAPAAPHGPAGLARTGAELVEHLATGGRRVGHGLAKPASLSTLCPAGDSTRSSNAVATGRFLLPLRVAIG